MKQRSATAIWNNDLKSGNGHISTESGVLKNADYSFGGRFEDGGGTNPEELIAASHAACFSMALSKEVNDEGLTPERIETKATVTLKQDDSGFSVASSHLELKGSYSGGDGESFKKAAQRAKKNCPISKLLNAEIELEIVDG